MRVLESIGLFIFGSEFKELKNSHINLFAQMIIVAIVFQISK